MYWMLGMAKVVVSILLSGMTAIGRTIGSGRRGYGSSSGRRSCLAWAAPVGLDPFDLLPVGGRWLGPHCKSSDTLSLLNREKMNAQCYGVSFRRLGQPGKRGSESLTIQLRNSFPAIREMSGIFPTSVGKLEQLEGRLASSQWALIWPLSIRWH
ncbi:hypothetical protein TNCV_831541 [Trichonephila clavipes]|nr:hypothetical protein TNCV_831541 [Trichonephila clavipes]